MNVKNNSLIVLEAKSHLTRLFCDLAQTQYKDHGYTHRLRLSPDVPVFMPTIKMDHLRRFKKVPVMCISNCGKNKERFEERKYPRRAQGQWIVFKQSFEVESPAFQTLVASLDLCQQ